MIDIGGPAMVRAAAKNHAHVAVVVDPKNYRPVIDELRADGVLSETTRRRLARAAFAHTAAYDAAIVTWFDDTDPDLADESLTVEEVDTAGALPRLDPSGTVQRAVVALRRESSSGGRSVPPSRCDQLVGLNDAARRQGVELPQLV